MSIDSCFDKLVMNMTQSKFPKEIYDCDSPGAESLNDNLIEINRNDSLYDIMP